MILPSSIKKRIETVEMRQHISKYIENFSTLPYFDRVLTRVLDQGRKTHGRPGIDEPETVTYTLFPFGYYTFSTDLGPNIDDIMCTDLGANHMAYMGTVVSRSTKRITIKVSMSSRILVEVIAPGIITLFIQADLSVDKKKARQILQDERAIGYGKLVIGS